MRTTFIWLWCTMGCWCTAFLLAKLMSLSNPYLLFALSYSFGCVFYIFYAYKTYKNNLIRKLLHVPMKYVIIGITGYYFYWVGNTESFVAFANDTGTASETTLINYTWTIFGVIFSELFFRKQKYVFGTAVFIEYAGLLTAFGGVYVLASGGNVGTLHLNNITGVAWGLLAGMSYGFFSAYVGSLSADEQPLFLLVSIVVSLFCNLVTATVVSQQGIVQELSELTFKQWIIAIVMGLIVDGFGYYCWTRTMSTAHIQNISLARVMAFMYLLPVLSLVVVAFFFNEKHLLQPYFIVTLLCIVGGSFLTQKATQIAKFFTT